MNIDKNVASRFWKRVQRANASECWPWLGGHTPYGYGAIWIKDRNYGAHRVSWSIANKGRDVPSGYQVCHHCDNPNCVNPRHLFVGTPMDNVNDKVRKGRGFRLPPASEHADKMPRGSQHWNAKLNDDVVKEIKRRSNGGARQGEIARAMGLTRTTVQRIVSRTTWKHVEP